MAEITGTEGGDTLAGTSEDDAINALGGNDTINASGGADLVYGGAGDDTIYGELGDDRLFGGSGRDAIYGGQGNDLVDGGDEADQLYDNDGGSDTLRGGAGDDTITFSHFAGLNMSPEMILIEGGTGNDTVTFSSSIYGVATIDLGEGADRLSLNQNYYGSTRMILGSGQDQVTLGGYFNTNATGVVGTHVFADFAAGAGGDVLDLNAYLVQNLANWSGENPFGAGYLRLVQQGSSTRLEVDRDAAVGSQGYVALFTFENTSATSFTAENFSGLMPNGSNPGGRAITGTEGRDTLAGTSGDDTISALGGNDAINAGGGADLVEGGAGDDTIYGELGNDRLFGGSGRDTIHGGQGNDLVDGGDEADQLYDNDGGSDTLRGGAGDDAIFISHSSSAGTSTEIILIEGGTGDDTVNFSNFNYGIATIDLGEGADRLWLNQNYYGSTRVILGSGQDRVTLDGYFNTNSFGAVGTHVFADFTAGAGGDVLDLNAYLTQNLIGWNGNNPFGAGYLRLVQQGLSTRLEIDRDGAGGPQGYAALFTFENTGATSFTAENFNGLIPDGNSPVGRTITGTEGRDILAGTLGDDVIDALGGNDVVNAGGGADMVEGGAGDDLIHGELGNDRLFGGSGRDTIHGGQGSDLIEGGDEADQLHDNDGGSDTLRGGAGDDTITLGHYANLGAPIETILIEGGTGNDTVEFSNATYGTTTIDLGDGADRLSLTQNSQGSTRMILGSGQDRVTLGGYFTAYFGQVGTHVFADFAAGPSGDVLDLNAYLTQNLIGWNGNNPFNTGYLRLVQQGTSTRLEIDRDAATGGYGYVTLFTFENTSAANFTAENFNGLSPRALTAAELATVFASAPAFVTEGLDTGFAIDVTLKNVTSATANVSIAFSASGSTATNGVDVSVPAFSGQYSISQPVPGNYRITLPTIQLLDDALAEGTEVVAVRVTVSGQRFENGTDTETVLVRLVDRGQTGGAGNDTLVGTRFADDLTGGAGNDVLRGNAGNDRIDGGSGLDTAVFGSAWRQTGISQQGDTVTVAGSDGRDMVTGVERFRFIDGTFVLDPDSLGAQVQRMYDTVLGRAPDAVGLDYWVDRMQTGLGLGGVATALAASPEFQQVTGGLNNAAFVDYVYQNALDRAPDPGGRAYWIGRLDTGLPRGEMLVGFSESAEHRVLTSGLVGQGWFDTNDNAQAVALFYDSFAGRRPDAAGLAYWTDQLDTGQRNLSQVADLFAASAEFQSNTANRSNAQIVDFMYRNTLDRDPDAGGRAYWTDRLDQGMGKGELLLHFSQSTEHATVLAADIIGGIAVV